MSEPATTQIAALPAASSPLAGTEVAPIETVGASTEKATARQIAEVLLALASTWTQPQTFSEIVRFGGSTDSNPALRDNNGVLEVRSGDDTVYLSLAAFTLTTEPTNFAVLPSPGSIMAGARALIADSTVTTFGSIVSIGGGLNIVPVWSDGTHWKVG